MREVLSEPKPKTKNDEKKLAEIRKYFNELRHNFSKKEIDEYRKRFYDIKNYRYLSASEIDEAREILNELEKSLKFKTFHDNVDSVIMMIFKIMMIIMILPMMMNTEKLKALEDYLKGLIEIVRNP